MEKEMLSRIKTATIVALIAGGAAFSANAQGVGVGVHVGGVGVGVGVSAPGYYYNEGYYPPGTCAGYNYYYDGDCGYAVYTGDVVIDGQTVNGPHYYRWNNDHPDFWYHGGWHQNRDWDHNYRWDHDRAHM
jgi:hypothetical protein